MFLVVIVSKGTTNKYIKQNMESVEYSKMKTIYDGLNYLWIPSDCVAVSVQTPKAELR